MILNTERNTVYGVNECWPRGKLFNVCGVSMWNKMGDNVKLRLQRRGNLVKKLWCATSVECPFLRPANLIAWAGLSGIEEKRLHVCLSLAYQLRFFFLYTGLSFCPGKSMRTFKYAIRTLWNEEKRHLLIFGWSSR